MVTRRAELGQWNTAAPVARLAIAALGGISPDARVIDPTCGDGAFLAAALAAGARRIVGIEIDPHAADRARELVDIESAAARRGPSASSGVRADTNATDSANPAIEIVVSDVLAPGLVDRVGVFDVAIGNPPYVRAGRVDPAIKRERARVLAADWPELDADLIDALARHADFSATCLLRTLRFVRPGGQLALVMSTALLHADGASTLWTAIERVARIEALIAAPAERWFADAAVNPMLLLARRHAVKPGDERPVSSSGLRTRDAKPGDRPQLFHAAPATSAGSNARASRETSAGSNAPASRANSADARSPASRATSGDPSPPVSRPATPRGPRILRLSIPTRDIALRASSLDDIARDSEARTPDPDRTNDVSAWGTALRAPSIWFAWREKAREHLVPLRELCEVRRGLTTGANDVFYVRRDEAKRLRLELRFLAPVVRSPFNGAPAPIAIAPDESPLVAIAVPPDAKLAKAPRIQAWFERHEGAAMATSAARRDPWWSLPVNPARLFFAKAYGPRFVQRLADTPMLADQRVYALHPKHGVDLVALAAVLNALPTALALESLGRGSMGYGAVEWTVHDALELPVLDVRRADARVIGEMHAALAAIARRPVAHVRLERDDAERARLDRSVLAMAPGGEMIDAMWDGLCASVAQRDRYLLPAV